jgi:HEPN domain-containing protein
MSETDRQLAEAWFRKAEGDLLNARNNLAADLVPLDTVCFHCQQMAEKYLKGVLAWHAQPFGRTHDLEALIALCSTIRGELAALREHANLLSGYAVDVRYPDAFDEPTLTEAEDALQAALAVKAAILSVLGSELRSENNRSQA